MNDPQTVIDWHGFVDAMQHKDQGLIVVDDFDDYASFNMREQLNVCVIPQIDPHVNCWSFIGNCGFDKITFATRDKSRTIKLIRTAIKAIKALDLHVNENDLEIPAYTWMANLHVRNADGDTNRLLEAAYKFDRQVNDPYEESKLSAEFWPVIQKHLDLSSDELLEKYEGEEYKRKQIRSHQVLNNAMKEAIEKLSENDVDGCRAAIWKGHKASGKIWRNKDNRPFETAWERWPGFLERLKQWRNRNVIGLETDMKQLTECLLGLRGLILLGADANLGKTLLSLQLAVQALRRHPDACCLFLSLEMHEDTLYERAAAAAINQTWRQLTIEGDDEKNEKATNTLEDFLRRFKVVEQDDCEEGPEAIMEMADKLKERTGCKRVLIIIDYLQVLSVPDEIERSFRHESESDRYRVEALKEIRNRLRKDDAMIVITEMRKPQGKTKKERFDNDDIMGSARLKYAADTILLWHNLTDMEKYQWLLPRDTYMEPRAFAARKPDKKKMDELEEHVDRVNEVCQMLNVRPAWLEITKARDGTIRRSIPITAYYDKLVIKEGFFGDGSDVQQTQASSSPSQSVKGGSSDDELERLFA